MQRILAILLGVCLVVCQACNNTEQATAEKPVIISTIKPIQALVYAVAGGEDSVFNLKQLLPDGASPHHYALKPSDRQALDSAKVIFQIDSGFETFLVQPLQNLGKGTTLISLSQAAGIQHLKLRAGHAHEGHVDEDLHLWLNPQNAIAMTRQIAQQLSSVDPAHKAQYQANAAQLIQRIHASDQAIAQQLAPLKQRPYLSFHDAWQHFDTHYQLSYAGSVSLDVSRLPGAKHVQDVRHIIESQQAVCLFQEPQFSPALVKTLADGAGIKIGQLDPLGVNLALTPTTYVDLLQNAATQFVECLK